MPFSLYPERKNLFGIWCSELWSDIATSELCVGSLLFSLSVRVLLFFFLLFFSFRPVSELLPNELEFV